VSGGGVGAWVEPELGGADTENSGGGDSGLRRREPSDRGIWATVDRPGPGFTDRQAWYVREREKEIPIRDEAYQRETSDVEWDEVGPVN